MIKKNDLFEAEITAMTAEGSGICRADGMAVFVPGTAVGDRCVVRVVKVLKKYAFGRLEELLTTSPDRTTPDCPIAGPCGGCVYRHITYEAELKIKTQRVRDALERIGGFENIPMEPILGARPARATATNASCPSAFQKRRNADGLLRREFPPYHRHAHLPFAARGI